MKENFQEALDMVDRDGKLRKTIWGQFWSSHQRFFKYLCMACKVPHVVELAKRALASNKCVVIGLQSTGEARTLEQLDECGGTGGEMSDFVSTARGVLQNLVDKYFPLIDHQTGAIKMNQPKTEPIGCVDSSANSPAIEGAGTKGKKSKSSQHVTNILQRLSSYASNKNDKRMRRTSSMSSLSSSSDNLDDNNNNKSDFDDDEADSMSFAGSEFDDDDAFFESSFDEDEFMSDFSSETEETNASTSINDSKSSLNQKKSTNVLNQTPLVSNQNGGDSSADFKPIVEAGAHPTNDDSDDSDSLFSITKSVSVQLLAEKNNLISRRKKLQRHLAKKRAAAEKKANEELNNDEMDANGTAATNFYFTSDESDDEFKLPTKRLKSTKSPNESLVKKEEHVEDLFR